MLCESKIFVLLLTRGEFIQCHGYPEIAQGQSDAKTLKCMPNKKPVIAKLNKPYNSAQGLL